jgi:hypothetical protein
MLKELAVPSLLLRGMYVNVNFYFVNIFNFEHLNELDTRSSHEI